MNYKASLVEAFLFLCMLRVRLLLVGKHQDGFVEDGLEFFEKKLKHYCHFETVVIGQPKLSGQLPVEEVKKREGDLLLKSFGTKSWVVLLDERGKEPDSPAFAQLLEKWMVGGQSQVDFVVGGAFGFSKEVNERANYQLSLSKMTFSHQIIRLIFAEQLYRAFTILKNEPYHHA